LARDCGSKNPNVVLWSPRSARLRPEPDLRRLSLTRWRRDLAKGLFKNEEVGAIDLISIPPTHRSFTRAMWNVRRPPWFIYAPANGPAAALQINRRRHDLEGNLGRNPLENRGRIGIAVATHESQSCLCMVDAKEGDCSFE